MPALTDRVACAYVAGGPGLTFRDGPARLGRGAIFFLEMQADQSPSLS